MLTKLKDGDKIGNISLTVIKVYPIRATSMGKKVQDIVVEDVDGESMLLSTWGEKTGILEEGDEKEFYGLMAKLDSYNNTIKLTTGFHGGWK